MGWAGLLGWGSWGGDCRGWGYWCGAAGVVAVGSVGGANGTGAGAAGPGAGGCCSGRGLLGCDCRGGVAGAVTEGMGVAGAGGLVRAGAEARYLGGARAGQWRFQGEAGLPGAGRVVL